MSDEISFGEPMNREQPFSIAVADRVHRLPPYLFAQINRLLYEKRRAGADVIDLGMGNPIGSPAKIWSSKSWPRPPATRETTATASPAGC